MEEEQCQDQNLIVDPIIYALTQVNVVSDDELFELTFASGNRARKYQTSPKHAKRIMLLLQKQLDAYEHKHGELQIQSPKPKVKHAEDPKIGFVRE
ncbi:MAG: hypothetical protein HYW95_02985 [Candidatus Wildermuthbacteria bacterium]|nr:hypothetical protein [Candidatus Wildermuthbacteria bacterium]